MSFRLKMASILATRSVLERQLDRVAEMTTGMLDEMVDDHAPEALEALQAEDRPLDGELERRRLVMADAHRRRVQVLVKALGETEAIEKGRRRMGPVGERLGADGSVEKRLTALDLERLDAAREEAIAVMEGAGVTGPFVDGVLNGGHLGGTVPLTASDADTMRPSGLPEGLWVADLSLAPRSSGLPTMLVAAALALRVARVMG